MARLTPLTSLLVASLLLTGCQGAAGVTSTKARAGAASNASPSRASTLTLTGAVMAPAGVVAAGGANVVAAGGANVVAAGGANFRALAVTQAPLAGTRVVLTDARGQAVAGVAEATTDAKGRYSFTKLPAGTYMVVAKVKTEAGKDAELRSLVKPGANAIGDVDASSTLSTAFMLDQFGNDMSGFDNATFRKMAGILARHMEASKLPDWSEPGEVLTAVKGMSESIAELHSLVDSLASLSPAAKEGTDRAKETLTGAEQTTKDAEKAVEDALKQAGTTTTP